MTGKEVKQPGTQRLGIAEPVSVDTVLPIDSKICIYLDALLADFSIEINIIKNHRRQAATTFKFSRTNRRSLNNNH